MITPCSARKRGDVPNPARAADLADPERRQEAEARLAEYACPAAEMYTSRHHQWVMAGVQAVWEHLAEKRLRDGAPASPRQAEWFLSVHRRRERGKDAG